MIYATDTRKKTNRRTPRGAMGQLIAQRMRETGLTREEVLAELESAKNAARLARENETLLAMQRVAIRAAQRRAAEYTARAEFGRRMKAIDDDAAREARVDNYLGSREN